MDKKKIIWIAIPIVLVICAVALLIVKPKLSGTNNATLPKENVFCSVSPNGHKTLFEDWVKSSLKIEGVPAYLICKDKKVIGTMSGIIDAESFKTQVEGYVSSYANEKPTKFKNISPENILNPFTNETTHFFDVCKDRDKLYVIELRKLGCGPCEEADKKYTADIRKSVDATFFRYYVKNTAEEVLEAYK